MGSGFPPMDRSPPFMYSKPSSQLLMRLNGSSFGWCRLGIFLLWLPFESNNVDLRFLRKEVIVGCGCKWNCSQYKGKKVNAVVCECPLVRYV